MNKIKNLEKLRILKKINRLEVFLNNILRNPNTYLYEIQSVEQEIDYLYSLLEE